MTPYHVRGGSKIFQSGVTVPWGHRIAMRHVPKMSQLEKWIQIQTSYIRNTINGITLMGL